mmetsp:Transcript_9841/g.36550  ORF Transcript_9841/g.36550 Transcript_9841/m.36550 type:complete len:220 (+) Transcript_9841:1921-2580(+)
MAFNSTSCITDTRSIALSASSARTRILSLPLSMARTTSAISSIASGPLKRLMMALFCLSNRLWKSRCLATTCGGNELGLSSMSNDRAYGALISPMSNFLFSDLPMPSSTENARTTNVSSAGNRKGWSLLTTNRSSPMFERICFRRVFFSSLVLFALKSDSYSSLFVSRCFSCVSTRWSKLPKKKSAVRFTAVRSPPVSTRTPILDKALTALSLFFSNTA